MSLPILSACPVGPRTLGFQSVSEFRMRISGQGEKERERERDQQLTAWIENTPASIHCLLISLFTDVYTHRCICVDIYIYVCVCVYEYGF